MEHNREHLELLRAHLDLLPAQKQAIANWLTREWCGNGKFPAYIRQRYWQYTNHNLSLESAPALVLRDLVLELLASNKSIIAKRTRVGAHKDIPLGPRKI